MRDVGAGRMPDLRKLPADLQEHLKENADAMLGSFAASQNVRESVDTRSKRRRDIFSIVKSPKSL